MFQHFCIYFSYELQLLNNKEHNLCYCHNQILGKNNHHWYCTLELAIWEVIHPDIENNDTIIYLIYNATNLTISSI